MEGATEGTLDSVAFSGVDVDQLRQAFRAVGVPASQDAGCCLVVCPVLLVANGALQNLTHTHTECIHTYIQYIHTDNTTVIE